VQQENCTIEEYISTVHFVSILIKSANGKVFS
jgi:hypothetical protein